MFLIFTRPGGTMIYLPTLHTFAMDNEFTGSAGALRFKITPQVVKNILLGPETRAVIIETYGSGNAPTKPWFLDIVREARQMGKVLVNVTQCPSGCVNMNLYATGRPLLEAGTVSGYDSTTESALAKLFHLLGGCADNERVKELFDQDLKGEITK